MSIFLKRKDFTNGNLIQLISLKLLTFEVTQSVLGLEYTIQLLPLNLKNNDGSYGLFLKYHKEQFIKSNFEKILLTCYDLDKRNRGNRCEINYYEILLKILITYGSSPTLLATSTKIIILLLNDNVENSSHILEDILYNPALPRDIDVDLHKSLDHTSVVCCVKFSNDGEYLATGCNKTTQVYRVSDGSLVARLSDDSAANNHRNSVTENNTTTSTDNNTMTTTTTTTITTTAMTTAAELAKDVENLNTSSSPSSDLYIRSVCFSPDGKFLATGAEDRLIRIWDIEKRKIVMILQGLSLIHI